MQPETVSRSGPLGVGVRLLLVAAAVGAIVYGLEFRAHTTTSPEARAVVDEALRDFDGTTLRGDAELEAFVARCTSTAEGERHPASRTEIYAVALKACGAHGSYGTARRLRAKLFDALLKNADWTTAGRGPAFFAPIPFVGRGGADGAAQSSEIAALVRSAAARGSAADRAYAELLICGNYRHALVRDRAALGPAEAADWERALVAAEQAAELLPEGLRKMNCVGDERAAFERSRAAAAASVPDGPGASHR